MEPTQEEIQNLVKKVKESQAAGMDLSSDEDLSIAIMNLVSIEEHFFFTGAKPGKSEYYELLNQAREIRKALLKKIVKEPEGEVWCLSKHLLAASMRLIESGTKSLNKGEKQEAEDLFGKAYQLYSMFWGLNLNLLSPNDLKNAAGTENQNQETEIKKINDDQLNVHDSGKTNFLGKLGEIVKKLLDCCKE